MVAATHSWAAIQRKGNAARRKFTADEIREVLASTDSSRVAAKRYGVNQKTIVKIRARETYAFVDAPPQPKRDAKWKRGPDKAPRRNRAEELREQIRRLGKIPCA